MAAATAATAAGAPLLHAPAASAASPGSPARIPLPEGSAAPVPLQADPTELTLAEAAAAIRDGRLSPVDLVDSYLDRIGRWDDVYLAFNTVLGTAARERAEVLDGEEWSGALHGIPLALKDNFYTAGTLTSANSYLYQDFVPDFDATAWRRLRTSGTVLLGKTQMGPLATSRATTPDGAVTTSNAWAPLDPDVSPGGSSSGSATAVAARLVPCATGTQTGGSITGPCNEQGLTGLKPTMGRVSLRGVIPLTYTRDHPGVMARDARDAAIVLQAMAGPDPEDPRTLGLPPVPDLVTAATPVIEGGSPRLRWPTTVGVLPGLFDVVVPEPSQLDGDAGGRFGVSNASPQRIRRERAREAAKEDALGELLSTLEDVGARVVELDAPRDWELLTGAEFNDVRLPERSEAFLQPLRDDVRSFGVSLAPWIHGLLLPGAEYVRGQRARLLLLSRILDDIFSRCDVVLQSRHQPFDIAGLPLAAFPIGFEDESIGSPRPVGALMGALPYAEDRLLSVVAAFQAATDFHRRRPVDPAERPPLGRMRLQEARPPWGSPTADRLDADLGRGRLDVDEVVRTAE